MTAAKPPVVIDTNILFSTLLGGGGKFTSALLLGQHEFFVCETVLVELFKRKEKIIACSRLSDEEVLRAYHILLRHLQLFKESLIPGERWIEARQLCQDVDETDTPHVALTLTLQGLLWTGDKRLADGLQKKGFHSFFAP